MSHRSITRMHSSRIRTARSLTVARSICHAGPPAMHAPCHAHPLPCMPPSMHAPPAMHAPHHTHTTLATHAPLPCLPPCGQNSWHMLLKIIPCPNFVAGGNKYTHASTCLTQPNWVITLPPPPPNRKTSVIGGFRWCTGNQKLYQYFHVIFRENRLNNMLGHSLWLLRNPIYTIIYIQHSCGC